MGRILMIAFLVFMSACGGNLTEEQRKEMQEASKLREIRKVTDQEIVQAALETGRMIRREIDKGAPMDSLENTYNVKIVRHYDEGDLTEVEKSLWEAYTVSFASGEVPADNIQRDYPEYLYYTYPLLDGDSLAGMGSIRLSRKEIIVNQ